MILRQAALALTLIVTAQAATAGQTASKESVKRIAFALNIAAGEYAKGVAGGRVTQPDEYGEARELFARAGDQFRRVARDSRLDDWTLEPVESALKALSEKIGRKEDPRAVKAAVERTNLALSDAFGVSTRPLPARPPSIELGRTVYQARCMLCHGPAGDGRGPAAPGLKTHPFDFTDRHAMRSLSPSQLWQTMTVGVDGTAMISWADYLSEQERWDVASYLRTFAAGPQEIAKGRELSGSCRDRLPSEFRDPSYWIEHSDEDAITKVAKACGFKTTESTSLVAFLRLTDQPAPRTQKASSNGAAFAAVSPRVLHALKLYAADSPDAADAALDAYIQYEPLEAAAAARDTALAAKLEKAFGRLRTEMAAKTAKADVEALARAIIEDLDRLTEGDAPRSSTWMLLLQSLLIILREGIEAILILAAIATALRRAGLTDRMNTLTAGAAAGVLASFATAWALDGLLRESGLSREALEGLTMLAAVAVLFFVSNWLLSKVGTARWKEFIDGRLRSALGEGGLFAIAAVAFLAVYREGFETVLFYHALFDLAAGAAAPVWAGLALGLVLLAFVFIGIQRFGLKIPVRGFFASTGALLFILAFSFAGQGIAALQMAGWLPTTTVGWLPNIPALNVHPTIETSVAQAILTLGMTATAVYTFLIAPAMARRRMRPQNSHAPHPALSQDPAERILKS
ncbi:MAG: cytochrome c/FTR1 family iron permease [Elusimicrobia bacterium]|nr:cytochrome c/FTR1 family iron permease [Elusimicrobiota bacterium]